MSWLGYGPRQSTHSTLKEPLIEPPCPGGQMVFSYRMPHAAGAVALIFRLRVEPDAFYRSLYESLLAAGETGQGEAQIRRALQDATDSAFIAYTTRLPLVGQDNTARKTGRPAKPCRPR